MTPHSAKDIDATNWWSKPSGGREVLQVAAPLVVSSLSWTILTFIDRMMLNHVSGAAMAGAFSASVAWFAVAALPLGVCTYASTFVAQYDGAGQQRRIGLVIWQAVWIALGFGLLFAAVAPLAPWLFGLAGHDEKTFAAEVQFYQIMCLGGPGLLVAQSLASFYSGRRQTWVMMIVEASIDVLCIGLDYCWIFGHFGFPRWEVAGAAAATATCLWIKAGIYLVLVLQRRYRDRYGFLEGRRWDGEFVRRMLYYGGPSGFQMLLDVAGFTTFILLVDRLGGTAAEATSIAFSISSLAFMPIYGLHIAVSVLVGERLGENREELASRVAITALQIALAYMLFISLLYVLVPSIFLHGFFRHSDQSIADQEAVRGMAAVLLQFVAAYNLLDATQMVFVGALKGAGDTRFLLYVSLVLSFLLATFSVLSVQVWQLNIFGCWTLIIFWCLIAAVTYVLRFRQGKWRSMRVIETPAATLA